MGLTQLNPSIPVYVPERKAGGEAWAVIDYGPEHDLLWVVCMDDTGEVWCVPNAKIRGFQNWSLGRVIRKPEEAKT